MPELIYTGEASHLLGCAVLIEWKGVFRKRKRNFLEVSRGRADFLHNTWGQKECGRRFTVMSGRSGRSRSTVAHVTFSPPKEEVRQNAEPTESVVHNNVTSTASSAAAAARRHLGRAAATGSSFTSGVCPRVLATKPKSRARLCPQKIDSCPSKAPPSPPSSPHSQSVSHRRW